MSCLPACAPAPLCISLPHSDIAQPCGRVLVGRHRLLRNRKVSLTISGWVNEQVQWWDDGRESNVYQGSSGTDQSRFRFVGKAKINKDWTAGYLIEIGLYGGNQSAYNQNNDDLSGLAVSLRHSAWFLESKTYGKVTVGQTSVVNDGITELSPVGVLANKQIQVFAANGGFALRNGASGELYQTTWDDLAHGLKGVGEGDRFNIVRYDSPEFGGFVASANWGEDDLWAVALRYSGELHGFKIAGGIAYSEISDGSQGFTGDAVVGNDEGHELGGSISALHVDSGLFASFAYGEAELSHRAGVSNSIPATADNDYSNWNIQAGVQKKFVPLGKTSVYGEYFKGDFGYANRSGTSIGTDGTRVASSDVDMWGATAIQSIEAAALDLYIVYRHYSADATSTTGTAMSIEDFDTVYSGAKISF